MGGETQTYCTATKEGTTNSNEHTEDENKRSIAIPFLVSDAWF